MNDLPETAPLQEIRKGYAVRSLLSWTYFAFDALKRLQDNGVQSDEI